MATHSSFLAWRIPGMGEPCGLLSMRSHRVGHDWSDLAAAAAEPKNCVFVVCVCVDKSTYLYLYCCCCSVTKLCLTLWTLWTMARQAFISFTISQSLLKLISFESAMTSNHLILCHPLLLLPSIFPTIRVFSNEVAKVLELQLQFFQWIFRIDFFKNWLLWSLCCPRDSQESSPTPQLEGISSLMLSLKVQLSHPYMSTEKKKSS